MQFNANQFRIKQRPPRSTIGALLAAVLLGALAAYAFYNASVANAAAASANRELKASQASVADLKAKLEQSKLELQTQVASTKEVCSNDTSALETKVAAFAKQAAVCEKIRVKIAAQ